jgi:hypothetical protein
MKRKFSGTAWAVCHGDDFCKFSSYGKVAFKSNPLAASLFQRKKDAEYQAYQEHWTPDGKVTGFVIVQIEVEGNEI